MSKNTLRRVGGIGLVAATVMTGLSFGVAPAMAVDVDTSAAPTAGDHLPGDGFDGPLIFTDAASNLYAVNIAPGDPHHLIYTPVSSAADAAEKGMRTIAPAIGESGPVRLPDGKCMSSGALSWVPYGWDDCKPGDEAQQYKWVEYSSHGQTVRNLQPVTQPNVYPTFQRWNSLDFIRASSNPDAAAARTIRTDLLTGALSADATSVDVDARTATIAGRAAPGAAVIVQWGSSEVQADADDSGEWSIEIDGLKLGSNPVHLEQWQAETKTAELDIDAELEVADITAAAAFGAQLTDRVVISGTAEPGATVEIRDADDDVIASVPADRTTGRYSAPIPAPNAAGDYAVNVNQVVTGERNGSVPVVVAYGAGASITSPVNDFVWDGGSLLFRGNGKIGARIDIREKGKTGIVGNATVLANGSWSTNVMVPTGGRTITYVATQTGHGNNVTTAEVTLNPDGSAITPVALTAPAPDAVITDTKRPVFSGTGEAGHQITVAGSSGRTIATATVEPDGTWTATAAFDFVNGFYVGTVRQSGDTATAAFNFRVNTEAAVIDPVALTSPAIGGTATGPRPVYTGTGHVGATIQVKGSTGRVVATTTVDSLGAWSVPAGFDLADGRYIGTVVQTMGADVKSVNYDFTVGDSAAIVLTSPAVGDTAEGPRPVFAGTGQQNATIEVKGSSGRVVASTTVESDGTWSVPASFDLAVGRYIGTVTQTVGTEVKSVNYDFSVTE